MNGTDNLTPITSKIKAGILRLLIGNTFPYKGSNRQIVKLVNWWKNGITYPANFDLSAIATQGQVIISVEFDLWVSIDWDGNSRPTGTVNGYFDNVIIGFSDSNFYVDLTNASISRLSIK